MATTAGYIQSGGLNYIYQSTTTGAGSWVPVHPAVRGMTLQGTFSGSSAGVLQTGTIQIQVSNDGVNPLATLAGTISVTSIATPAVDGFAMDAHWNFIRANQTLVSTTTGSTANITVSVHDIK